MCKCQDGMLALSQEIFCRFVFQNTFIKLTQMKCYYLPILMFYKYLRTKVMVWEFIEQLSIRSTLR